MAKRRYRRFYKRKSGRWSANIQEINANVSAPSGIFSTSETIVTNPVQQTSLTSQTYTIKNVEITFNIDYEAVLSTSVLEGLTVYIMYVPQGMVVTSDYNLQHPEYIMAYKYIGSPSVERADIETQVIYYGQQYQPIRVKTRLSRKLQTGDNIVLFLKGINQDQNSRTFRIDGIIRWWSKAN
jgi:hypothetical protein